MRSGISRERRCATVSRLPGDCINLAALPGFSHASLPETHEITRPFAISNIHSQPWPVPQGDVTPCYKGEFMTDSFLLRNSSSDRGNKYVRNSKLATYRDHCAASLAS